MASTWVRTNSTEDIDTLSGFVTAQSPNLYALQADAVKMELRTAALVQEALLEAYNAKKEGSSNPKNALSKALSQMADVEASHKDSFNAWTKVWKEREEAVIRLRSRCYESKEKADVSKVFSELHLIRNNIAEFW